MYPLNRIITDPGQWFESINVTSIYKFPPLYKIYNMVWYFIIQITLKNKAYMYI